MRSVASLRNVYNEKPIGILSLRDFYNDAFQIFPMLVLLAYVLSRNFKIDRQALPFSTPLYFRVSMA